MKKKDETPTTKELLILLRACNEDHQSELIERLYKQPKPYELCGVVTPDNLYGISYGMLDDLQQSLREENTNGLKAVSIILGVDEDKVMSEDANKVFGFISFIVEQLTAINKLFDSLNKSFSSDEEQAGVRSLNFGSFGVLDWYARRMGITNQIDVRSVAWTRIYQCMKMDNQKSEYERKLRDIQSKKQSTRKR